VGMSHSGNFSSRSLLYLGAIGQRSSSPLNSPPSSPRSVAGRGIDVTDIRIDVEKPVTKKSPLDLFKHNIASIRSEYEVVTQLDVVTDVVQENGVRASLDLDEEDNLLKEIRDRQEISAFLDAQEAMGIDVFFDSKKEILKNSIRFDTGLGHEKVNNFVGRALSIARLANDKETAKQMLYSDGVFNQLIDDDSFKKYLECCIDCIYSEVFKDEVVRVREKVESEYVKEVGSRTEKLSDIVNSSFNSFVVDNVVINKLTCTVGLLSLNLEKIVDTWHAQSDFLASIAGILNFFEGFSEFSLFDDKLAPENVKDKINEELNALGYDKGVDQWEHEFFTGEMEKSADFFKLMIKRNGSNFYRPFTLQESDCDQDFYNVFLKNLNNFFNEIMASRDNVALEKMVDFLKKDSLRESFCKNFFRSMSNYYEKSKEFGGFGSFYTYIANERESKSELDYILRYFDSQNSSNNPRFKNLLHFKFD
jgi:hypothetical protein